MQLIFEEIGENNGRINQCRTAESKKKESEASHVHGNGTASHHNPF